MKARKKARKHTLFTLNQCLISPTQNTRFKKREVIRHEATHQFVCVQTPKQSPMMWPVQCRREGSLEFGFRSESGSESGRESESEKSGA